MGLGGPKSLPSNSPGVTETEGQIRVSQSPRIEMRADLRAEDTTRGFWSSFPRPVQSVPLKSDGLGLPQLEDSGRRSVTRVTLHHGFEESLIQ